MKAILKYFAMATVAVASMTACSNDADDAQSRNASYPVQFSMNLNGSRTVTATDAARTTTWVDGDAVGIFVCKHGTKELVKTNAKYVLSGETWNAANEDSKIYADQAYDFYAYYPYDEAATDPTNLSTVAQTDQTSADDYAKSDFLSAKNVSTVAGATNVSLTFSHLFAMVEVKVQGDKVTQKPTKATLDNVKLAGSVDITADAPTATLTADAATSVNMYYLGKTENADQAPFVFRAVVPAQEVAAGTPLVSIENPTAESKTYTMKYSAAVTYETGKCRQISVNIATDKVELTIPATDFTFNPWGSSDNVSGGGNEVIEPAQTITNFTLPIETATSFTDLKGWQTAANHATGKNSFWYHRENGAAPATTVSVENGSLTLVTADTKPSWNNSTIGYHCKDLLEKGLYKVSITVSSETGSGIVGIGVLNGLDTKLFRILNGSKADWARTVTTFNSISAEVTKTFYIDTTKSKAEGKASNVTEYDDSTDEELNAGFNIIIYSYQTNNTLTIKELKLEKSEE